MTDELNPNADAGRVDRMVMAHSLGPWRVVNHTGQPGEPIDGADDWTIYGADGKAVCTECGKLPDEAARANVALIVAAPEMLAALRKAAVLLALLCDDVPELAADVEYEAVSAAITKATGCAP